MKSPFFFFFLLFSAVCITAAMSSLGTFKQYDCVDLLQICDNCTYNNITSVVYPNSSIALNEVKMTKIGTQFNYSDFCLTTETGIYKVNGFGDLDGKETVWVYDFTITPSGKVSSSFLNNPFLLILFGLGLILFIFAYSSQISWLGFISAVMFLLCGIWVMIYGFNDVTNLYTRGAGITIIGFGMIVMIVSGFELFSSSTGEEE